MPDSNSEVPGTRLDMTTRDNAQENRTATDNTHLPVDNFSGVNPPASGSRAENENRLVDSRLSQAAIRIGQFIGFGNANLLRDYQRVVLPCFSVSQASLHINTRSPLHHLSSSALDKKDLTLVKPVIRVTKRPVDSFYAALIPQLTPTAFANSLFGRGGAWM
jgi:hypothetical protein